MKNEVKAMYDSPQSEVVSLKLSGSIADAGITITSSPVMVGDNPNGDTYTGGKEDW